MKRFGMTAKSVTLRAVLLVGALVGLAETCSAQMFAIYADSATDGEYVYAGASYYQDPNYYQCNHANSEIGTLLTSPTGRWDTAVLPFNDEEGYWTADADYSADCSCAGPIYAEDQEIKLFSIHISYNYGPTGPYPGTGMCIYSDFACTGGSPTCGSSDQVVWGFKSCPAVIQCRWVKDLFCGAAGPCSGYGGEGGYCT